MYRNWGGLCWMIIMSPKSQIIIANQAQNLSIIPHTYTAWDKHCFTYNFIKNVEIISLFITEKSNWCQKSSPSKHRLHVNIISIHTNIVDYWRFALHCSEWENRKRHVIKPRYMFCNKWSNRKWLHFFKTIFYKESQTLVM